MSTVKRKTQSKPMDMSEETLLKSFKPASDAPTLTSLAELEEKEIKKLKNVGLDFSEHE